MNRLEPSGHEGLRVGFSPVVSPPLGVSGLRAALFAWLHARAQGGTLVLRIADAQGPRVRDELTSLLLESLRWIQIDWQEGPDVQGPWAPYQTSRRTDTYREPAKRLLEQGLAYRCFCPKDALEDEDEAPMRRSKRKHRCPAMGSAESARKTRALAPAFLRIRADACGRVTLDDLVRGRLSASPAPDAFLVDPDGAPFEAFASAVDDAALEIDVAFREDGALEDSALQLRIALALGLPSPRLAHVPMIVGLDGRRFGKRHGAANAASFRRLGYHPRALTNYLVGLSWKHPAGLRRFDPAILQATFSKSPVRPESSVFDFKDLNRLSAETIREESPDLLLDRVYPYLLEGGFIDEDGDRARLRQVVEVCREHLSCLSEIVKFADIFFGETYIEPKDRKVLRRDKAQGILLSFRERISRLPILDGANLETVLSDIQKQMRLSREAVLMPIRLALTGQTEGPDVRDVAPIIGMRACAEKVERALHLTCQE